MAGISALAEADPLATIGVGTYREREGGREVGVGERGIGREEAERRDERMAGRRRGG
jgi:hypothetical protein